MHTVYDDIEGKSVADFGCGGGVFCVGCEVLGSGYVVGLDIDTPALELAQRNFAEVEVEPELIQCDVTSLLDQQPSSRRAGQLDDGAVAAPVEAASRLLRRGPEPVIDTVIMNPPFGTKNNSGIDMLFLRAAFDHCSTAVYSLHKTSTRDHVVARATEWGARAEVVAELRFDLPATYKFHKNKSVDVAVDFIRFDLSGRSR